MQPSDELGFVIYRFSGAGWNEVGRTGPNTTTFTNTNLDSCTTYYYTVGAYNGGGTAWARAITPPVATCSAPAAPTNLSATALSSSSIRVTWQDNANNETGIVIYRFDGTGWSEVGRTGANVTSFSDTGRQGCTTYYYTVAAYNGAGSAGASGSAQATTTCP